MKPASIVVAAMLLTAACPTWSETVRGKLTGGEVYTLPEWFKTSFLNFKDDVEEAKKQGKHLMGFLHLEECSYCVKMLNENFMDGERRDTIHA